MAAPGVAVPGSVVAIGSQASPAGPQGIQGPSAVSANANNKATLGSDSLVLVQGTAAGVAATTHAQTVSGDDPQLTNARTPTVHGATHLSTGADPFLHQASHVTGGDQIPNASATARGLLNQTSGNTTDFIDGTNNSQALQPVIWSATRRVFNSIGNPTFEVDQRNVGNLITNPATGVILLDRWSHVKVGTMAFSMQSGVVAPGVVVPGTNFRLSRAPFLLTLTTQQASLGAGDHFEISQIIEGPRFRALSLDVHSVSLLVYTSVAGLKFSVAVRDNPPTQSLVKLCTVPSANTWTLITLPNLPVWPSANFALAPGLAGYELRVCLAAGTTFVAPAADVWQSGNFTGAPGMDNFASKPVNSTFYLGFAQHEPGAQCTTPIDCPFTQNYDDCLRYFQKTYDYDVAVGTASAVGTFSPSQLSTLLLGGGRFHKPMAKIPTMTAYNQATGAANSFRMAGTDYGVTSFNTLGKAGFLAVNTATLPAVVAGAFGQLHYTADTGW